MSENDKKNVYPSDDNQPFRMPIEEWFNLEDVGLMVIGPIQEEGRLKEGDRIVIHNTEKKIQTRVAGIDIRGDSLGIKLGDDVSQDQIEVGMIVTTEGA